MRCSWPCRDMGGQDKQGPCSYRIRLEGELSSSLSDRLGGTVITIEWREGREPVTVLLSSPMAEAALAEVLRTLFQQRLTVLSVEGNEPDGAIEYRIGRVS